MISNHLITWHRRASGEHASPLSIPSDTPSPAPVPLPFGTPPGALANTPLKWMESIAEGPVPLPCGSPPGALANTPLQWMESIAEQFQDKSPAKIGFMAKQSNEAVPPVRLMNLLSSSPSPHQWQKNPRCSGSDTSTASWTPEKGMSSMTPSCDTSVSVTSIASPEKLQACDLGEDNSESEDTKWACETEMELMLDLVNHVPSDMMDRLSDVLHMHSARSSKQNTPGGLSMQQHTPGKESSFTPCKELSYTPCHDIDEEEEEEQKPEGLDQESCSEGDWWNAVDIPEDQGTLDAEPCNEEEPVTLDEESCDGDGWWNAPVHLEEETDEDPVAVDEEPCNDEDWWNATDLLEREAAILHGGLCEPVTHCSGHVCRYIAIALFLSFLLGLAFAAGITIGIGWDRPGSHSSYAPTPHGALRTFGERLVNLSGHALLFAKTRKVRSFTFREKWKSRKSMQSGRT